MTQLLESFFSPHHTSVKICGITTSEDAHQLVAHQVPAIGLNFWPKSKRFCSHKTATTLAPIFKGNTLRVGVFVNASEEDVLSTFEHDLIDVAQFHGDEPNSFLARFAQNQLPFIKAIGVSDSSDLNALEQYHTPYLLLDAHAPGVYGGTGECIDWDLAATLIQSAPHLSIMLAGGITPLNAATAVSQVAPCALDIASGAESAPGIKDFDKVRSILHASAS